MAFDVNAARAQRLEANGEKFEFVIDGETFNFPTELPVDVLETMANAGNDLKQIVSAVMNDVDASTRFFAHKVSVQDVRAILDAWRSETGASVGEDSPSVS